MKEKRTDMLVGIFLFVGLLVLGGIIIRFGSFSENFREKYALTLTYPDAGGIVKGSDVRLGGAKIGRVARTPYLQPDATGVVVDLEIYNEYRIPENATFHVAVSGLLGDSYISIRPPKVPNGEFIKPGAEVAGKPSAGFDTLASTAEDLSRKGEAMLDEVRDALKDLNSAIEKLDQGILGEENIKRFNEATLELATALHALNDRVLGKENIDKKVSSTYQSPSVKTLSPRWTVPRP